MQSILQELAQQFDKDTVDSLSQRLGANQQTTQNAISGILPMLIGGLARNVSSSPQGAQALDAALERDHDGSLLESLGGLLRGGTNNATARAGGGGLLDILSQVAMGGNSRATNGAGILGHILGGNQQQLSQQVSQNTGLGSAQVQQLMVMLAPMLMATLGKRKRQQHLDANGVSHLLEEERNALERNLPNQAQGGLLGMLDVNNDGKVDAQDALAQAGKSLMGGLFRS